MLLCSGDVVGICSCHRYSPTLSFMGFYAVREKLRGKGVGVKLWRAAQARAEGRTIGLNAVPAELATYRDKAGFRSVFDDVRAQIFVGEPCPPDMPPGRPVRAVEPKKDLHLLEEYDEKVHGFHRGLTVAKTIVEKGAVAALAESPNGIAGYGVLKTDIQDDHVIFGPLYADDPNTARRLAATLLKMAPPHKKVVYMGISKNPHSLEVAQFIGLPLLEEDKRCYTKDVPMPDYSRVYGQHDLNFCPF